MRGGFFASFKPLRMAIVLGIEVLSESHFLDLFLKSYVPFKSGHTTRRLVTVIELFLEAESG